MTKTRPIVQMFKWKTDNRPQRYGWAPGDYVHLRCAGDGCKGSLDSSFIGAKRAMICADCAYAMPWPPVETPRPDPVDLMIDAYNTVWEAETHIDAGNVARVRRNAIEAALWAYLHRPL